MGVMLTGRSVHLLAETIGVDDHQQVVVVLPAGESITVLSGPRPDDKGRVNHPGLDRSLNKEPTSQWPNPGASTIPSRL